MLDRNVVVTSEGSLRILPGTEVFYVERSVCEWTPAGRIWVEPEIQVRGRVLCQGTQDSMIVFTGGDEYFGRSLSIYSAESLVGDSVVEWADLGFVQWGGGNPILKHSRVTDLGLHSCGEILIEDCAFIGRLGVHGGGTGVIRGSEFVSGMSLYDDRLHITENVFSGVASSYWGAIRVNADSRSLITWNLFEDCNIAVGIYSGTPELHHNNFVDNGCNISVIAEPLPVETDTLDARENWWGTTDEPEILAGIHYEERDGYYSGKTVLHSPFALEPFDLPHPREVQATTKTSVWDGSETEEAMP